MKKKYLAGNGLAFSEEKDMKNLSKLSEDGWVLTSFKGIWYVLEKRNEGPLDYCVNYINSKEIDEEYLELMHNSGWQEALTHKTFTIYKAKRGTTPIFTSTETLLHREYDKRKCILKITLICGLIGLCLLPIGLTSTNAIPLIITCMGSSFIGVSLILCIGLLMIQRKIKTLLKKCAVK